MLQLILESLDENRLKIFRKLTAFRDVGILGGGTSLALQIGHRISFDFDIFTHKKLNVDLWKRVKKVFGEKSVKLLDNEDQLNLTTPENVGVTFFYDDYRPIFAPINIEPINLMDIRDIAATKAFILNRRPKWRDYVDLYYLLNGKCITLEELIRLSKKKFGSDFAEKLFLEELVYWKDIKDYGIEFIGTEIDPEEIKKFLENEARKFSASLKA